MVSSVTVVLVVLSLAVAGWAGVLVALDRVIDLPLFVAAGVLELAMLGQLALSLVLLGRPDHTGSVLLFVLYLVVLVVLLPVGAVWATLEHSRWGPAVLAVACLAEPVVLWRLTSVWATHG